MIQDNGATAVETQKYNIVVVTIVWWNSIVTCINSRGRWCYAV